MGTAKWMKRAEKNFHRYYRPFSAGARSILCKIESKKEISKALVSILGENKVSAMDE